MLVNEYKPEFQIQKKLEKCEHRFVMSTTDWTSSLKHAIVMKYLLFLSTLVSAANVWFSFNENAN